jgi:hypothetical protein
MSRDYLVLHNGRVVYEPGHYSAEDAETVLRTERQIKPGGTFQTVRILTSYEDRVPDLSRNEEWSKLLRGELEARGYTTGDAQRTIVAALLSPLRDARSAYAEMDLMSQSEALERIRYVLNSPVPRSGHPAVEAVLGGEALSPPKGRPSRKRRLSRRPDKA